MNITTAGRAILGEQGLAFARELAAQAARFAAECERLHAQYPAGAGKAAEDSAA